eukprot:431548-Pelagomonas_calceolata.AAC.1
MQRLTTIINTRRALWLLGASGVAHGWVWGGALGARRWIQGEGESGRLEAWPTPRPILIRSVSFPLLG